MPNTDTTDTQAQSTAEALRAFAEKWPDTPAGREAMDMAKELEAWLTAP